MYSSFRSLFISFLVAVASAQYPPASNLTTIKSPVDGNITISYKQPPVGTCKTAFETQQQYTGWVNIPGNYSTNTFFWFFGARQPTDSLTIWLNGGPGSSSMLGLFTENGPCEVVELAQGKFGTIAREYGWDRGSNILYIDQPNQVGFSYDTPTNGSLDLLTSDLYTPPQVLPNSQPTDTFMNGTFNTLNLNNTANTTEIAAMAIWHMLQGFLGAFPQYMPNSTSVGVHLFAESYGGKYGPAFATLWEQQNNRRSNGTISRNGTLNINLASLGLINGCVDDLVQAPYYPTMAINNTFGLTSINPTRAKLASASFTSNGGCRDLINQCRAAVGVQDPNNEGDVGVVNSLCSNAYTFCNTNIVEPYTDAGRSIYDIAHLLPDSFPPSTYLEYLNNADFLAAIGSPVNYTETNTQVVKAFTSTGDYERQGYVPDIAALLNAGIRVGFMYGDRDYICNWLGGEAISLAVAAQAGGLYPTLFPSAGYAPIITNTSYIGGVVRQYGNLSFSRIYDAGHSVPAYQPETAFEVFARIMSGTSVSTGEIIDPSVYNTTGPSNATHTASLPLSPTNTCWLRNILETCNDDQKNKIIANEGAIINGVLYDAASDWSSPGSSATVDVVPNPSGTGSVSVTTTTEVLTGLFTATSTPSPTKKKSLATHLSALNGLLLLMLIPFLL
ncbi:Carboxypeptidase S1-like protein [Lachnellula hyalina]|uniref:Carboxypeptidase n=1 Tax=Lachnellula hyalina TaxID=1316788 RepID=A0A8H8U455_9HELO|nr:Carboxypeptidase S1-like protein [Lachnellula hyalina]TVY29862.1 Carboxypeptidase S1-like protein [Lachnellula hyalina]